MKRVVALALLLTACGRYDDFRLPAPPAGTPPSKWRWEPISGPVLPRGPANTWDSVDTLNPSIVRKPGGEYMNFYSGFDGTLWNTGLATSKDGLSWQKQGPVIVAPANSYIAANGSAYLLNGTYYYWYQSGKLPSIKLATSTDGLKWTHQPEPALKPGPRGAWDERGVADPYVIRIADTFYMFFLGQDRARRQRLGMAKSDDGRIWTKLRSNPTMELGDIGAFDENGLGEPAVWAWRGSYWMLYTGRDKQENRKTGLAQSKDGLHWQRVSGYPPIAGTEPWNSRVICDPEVELQPDGRVRVWFGGGDVARPDEHLNGQIGAGWLIPEER